MKIKNLFIVIILLILTIMLVGCNKKEQMKNPYEEVQEYDGIYKFSVEFEEDYGEKFPTKIVATGLLELENGICKIKYATVTKDSSLTTSSAKEYSGFYGIKNGDKSKLYIQFKCNSDDYLAEYICSISDTNLLGESLENSRQLPLLKKVEKITFEHISNKSDLEKTYNELIENIKTPKNPYETTNEYDGTYQFTTSWAVDQGTVTHSGLMILDNGKCEIHSNTTRDFISDITEHSFKGFYGKKNKDDSAIYLYIYSVKDDEYNYYEDVEYECVINEKDLECKLIYGNEITILTKNDKTDFTYYTDNTNLNEVKQQIEKEKKIKEIEEFKESCSTVTFEELARNPEKIKGTNVKLTGEVVQAIYGTYSNSYRVNITKWGSYSTYYKDTVYVTYTPENGQDKILEDDIITIWGTAGGDYSYTSTIGATITLPLINAKCIEIN